MSFVGDVIKGVFGFDDAPAPDPRLGEAAASNAQVGNRLASLAEKQYADQSGILEQFLPLLREQIIKSNEAQGLSTQRSNDAWADYTSTFRPLEQTLASKSLDWASPTRIKSEAERAGAEVTGEFDRARTTTTRNLSMAGASPEKIAALEAASRLEEAKAVGGAQGAARRSVEQQGMAYLDNAAKFGRNMTSTGIETARLAGQQGAQVGAGIQGLQGAAAAPAQYSAPLFGASVGANNSAIGGYNTLWNIDNANVGTNNAFAKDLMDATGKVAGMYFSSKTMKDVGAKVGGKEAEVMVEESPSKRWSYHEGKGDGSTKARMGPMAEDLRDATGGVVSDGKEVDGIALMGLHHAAIGGHAKKIRDQERRMRRLEKRLSLADAEA